VAGLRKLAEANRLGLLGFVVVAACGLRLLACTSWARGKARAESIERQLEKALVADAEVAPSRAICWTHAHPRGAAAGCAREIVAIDEVRVRCVDVAGARGGDHRQREPGRDSRCGGYA